MALHSRMFRHWLEIIFLSTLVAVIAWMTLDADAKECLSSAEAVRAEHGMETYSSWSRKLAGHEGEKCYFVGKRKEVVQNDNGTRRRQRRIEQSRNDIRPAPIAPAADHTPQDDGCCWAMRHSKIGLANEIRWRRALSERLAEWFAIYDQTHPIEIRTSYTFGERYAAAFPTR